MLFLLHGQIFIRRIRQSSIHRNQYKRCTLLYMPKNKKQKCRFQNDTVVDKRRRTGACWFYVSIRNERARDYCTENLGVEQRHAASRPRLSCCWLLFTARKARKRTTRTILLFLSNCATGNNKYVNVRAARRKSARKATGNFTEHSKFEVITARCLRREFDNNQSSHINAKRSSINKRAYHYWRIALFHMCLFPPTLE